MRGMGWLLIWISLYTDAVNGQPHKTCTEGSQCRVTIFENRRSNLNCTMVSKNGTLRSIFYFDNYTGTTANGYGFNGTSLELYIVNFTSLFTGKYECQSNGSVVIEASDLITDSVVVTSEGPSEGPDRRLWALSGVPLIVGITVLGVYVLCKQCGQRQDGSSSSSFSDHLDGLDDVSPIQVTVFDPTLRRSWSMDVLPGPSSTHSLSFHALHEQTFVRSSSRSLASLKFIDPRTPDRSIETTSPIVTRKVAVKETAL